MRCLLLKKNEGKLILGNRRHGKALDILCSADLIWLQISRNAETGVSRGCGFVTMSSVNEAKLAIAALDGSVSVNWN